MYRIESFFFNILTFSLLLWLRPVSGLIVCLCRFFLLSKLCISFVFFLRNEHIFGCKNFVLYFYNSEKYTQILKENEAFFQTWRNISLLKKRVTKVNKIYIENTNIFLGFCHVLKFPAFTFNYRLKREKSRTQLFKFKLKLFTSNFTSRLRNCGTCLLKWESLKQKQTHRGCSWNSFLLFFTINLWVISKRKKNSPFCKHIDIKFARERETLPFSSCTFSHACLFHEFCFFDCNLNKVNIICKKKKSKLASILVD